jgi:hypothetical protein
MADINRRVDGCDDEQGRRGHRGHRGHRGATGPTGPAGSGSAINELKFSGLAAVAGEVLTLTSFLADTGNFPGAAPVTVALNYPVPFAFEVGSFASNVKTALTVPLGGSILFQLRKNGVVVATITYGPGDTNGIKTTTFSPVLYAVGDTLDVAIVTTPGIVLTGAIDVSAMIGP